MTSSEILSARSINSPPFATVELSKWGSFKQESIQLSVIDFYLKKHAYSEVYPFKKIHKLIKTEGLACFEGAFLTISLLILQDSPRKKRGVPNSLDLN